MSLLSDNNMIKLFSKPYELEVTYSTQDKHGEETGVMSRKATEKMLTKHAKDAKSAIQQLFEEKPKIREFYVLSESIEPQMLNREYDGKKVLQGYKFTITPKKAGLNTHKLLVPCRGGTKTEARRIDIGLESKLKHIVIHAMDRKLAGITAKVLTENNFDVHNFIL